MFFVPMSSASSWREWATSLCNRVSECNLKPWVLYSVLWDPIALMVAKLLENCLMMKITDVRLDYFFRTRNLVLDIYAHNLLISYHMWPINFLPSRHLKAHLISYIHDTCRHNLSDIVQCSPQCLPGQILGVSPQPYIIEEPPKFPIHRIPLVCISYICMCSSY